MTNAKRFISKVLAALMLLTVLAVPFATQADAATVPSYLPIKGYTRYTSNVYTYSSINGSRTGYIAPNDYITINNVYSNGWCRVTYPTARGNKTAYCKSVALFVNIDFSTGTGYFGVSKAVYSKPNLSKKIGTVYANDHVMIVGIDGNATQIIYPISGGYKIGFVQGKYMIGNGNNNNNNNNNSSVYLNVPDYKQYDSRWAYTKLGNTSVTIKSKGCITTCIAMSESYLTGSTIYPSTIARTYRYTSGASMYWPSNYTTVTNTSNYMSTIYNQLKRGRPVLVGAKTSSGGQHWVLVTGYNGNGINNKSNYRINDPNSSTRTNLQQFFNKYTRYYKIAYRK